MKTSSIVRGISWPLYALADLVVTAISYFVAPLCVLCAGDNDHLPRYLRWFDTFDNPLDGDGGWIEKFPSLTNKGKARRFLKRTLWLWRNAAYTFSRDVVGAKVSESNHVICIGERKVGNRPLHNGILFAYTDEGYWELYIVAKWGAKCLRIRLGWKLKNKVDHPEWEGTAMLVYSINPFMGYSEE